MDNISGTIAILFSVLEFVFNIWWLGVLAPASAKPSRRRKQNLLREMLVSWGIMAFFRVVLILKPEPVRGYFIPEPLNTTLFVLVGVGLFALHLLIEGRKRQQFQKKTGEVNDIEGLLLLTPTEFEDMVVELYRIAGHEAQRTGAVGDHGVDVVVKAKDGEKWIVQCKRWRGYIGEPIIRDFYGTMQHEKADKGTIITAGRFSQPAKAWAKGKPIRLYDGESFLKAWRQAKKQQSKALT